MDGSNLTNTSAAPSPSYGTKCKSTLAKPSKSFDDTRTRIEKQRSLRTRSEIFSNSTPDALRQPFRSFDMPDDGFARPGMAVV